MAEIAPSPKTAWWENMDIMYISVEMTISLASVVGNVFVVLVVSLDQALRDPTFCFIVSLAIADIAVGALVIPLAIFISLGLKTYFYTCLFLSCLLIILTQGSILSLLAIAIDRYLRIKIPIRYSVIVTQRRAWIAVALCWIFSALIGLVPMFGWHQNIPGNSSALHIQCNFTSVMCLDYMVYFAFLGWLLVPLIIIVGLYAEIFHTIHNQLNHRAKACHDSRKYYHKELRLAKSLALILFLFAICWLPIHIINCIIYFCPLCNVPLSVINVAIFMSHTNSALNPLVYAFRMQRFQDSLLQIGKRCLFCKGQNQSSSNYPPVSEKVNL